MSSDVTHIITIKINTFPVLFPWVRDAGSGQNLDKISNKYSQSHTHMEDDKMKIQWNSGISLDTLDGIDRGYQTKKWKYLSKDLPQS